MNKQHILIMDDDRSFLEIFQERMECHNYQVTTRTECRECVDAVKAVQPDLVFLDIDFGSNDTKRQGVQALSRLREHWSEEALPVIMLSGTGDTSILSETLHMGANDYFYKPIQNFDELIEKVEAVFRDAPEQELPPESSEASVLGGRSKLIMNVTKTIIRAAQAGIDTLFQGETGTGKEVAARMYHRHSPHADKAMVVVNCPSIPTELFESEIFGFNKGAFGNAQHDQPGLVEKADGGILFMDEIGHLSLAHQSKLLRYIQFRTFKRLGDTKERTSRAIVLAASSRDLKKMAEEGKFLKELYYRFEKGEIVNIPPLRDRREDIPHVALQLFERYKIPAVTAIAPEVLEVFKTLSWDGNVRQLENCIINGIRKCTKKNLAMEFVSQYLTYIETETEDTMLAVYPRLKEMNYTSYKQFEDETVKKMRKAFYQYHLEKHHGNVSQTAKALGMTREFLSQTLTKLDIQSKKTKE